MLFKKILIAESLLFIGAGAGAGARAGVGEKITRSRSKMDRLRNTGKNHTSYQWALTKLSQDFQDF